MQTKRQYQNINCEKHKKLNLLSKCNYSPQPCMHLFASHSKTYKMLNICNKKIANFFTYMRVSGKCIWGIECF